MPGNGLSPFCILLPSTLSPWEQLLLALEAAVKELRVEPLCDYTSHVLV